MRRLAPLAALLLVPAALASTVSLEEGRMRFDAPEGWESLRDPARDARQKVYGYVLRGPSDKEGPATITVEYYSAGNGLFDGPKDFLDANTRRLEGPRPRVAEKTFAGRKAWTFTADRKEVLRATSERPDVRDLREEYWVIEAKDGAFHAAFLTAPARQFKSRKKTFDRLLKSLELDPA